MRNKRVLFYGDSNTHGYNTFTRLRFDKNIRFTGIISERLKDMDIIPAGLNSRTTNIDDEFESYINGMDCIEATVLSNNPLDLIVIMLGTNDFKIRYHREVQDSIRDLKIMVEKCRFQSNRKSDVNKPAKILLVSPIEIASHVQSTKNGDDFDEESVSKIKEYNKEVEKLSKELDTYYLCASDYASPCTFDALHLDEAGHLALADAFETKIKEIFECN